MALFKTILISLFVVVFFYITHQLTRFADFSFGMNLGVILFVGFMFALVLAMPLYFWSERRERHEPWHDSFMAASHMAMAYINFLVAFVILRDLLAFAFAYLPSPIPEEVLYDKQATGILLLVPFVLIILGTIVVRGGPKLKPVNLSFPNLPESLEGFKILHITDLHLGSSMPISFVQKLADVAKKTSVDVVVYTGDIMDSHAIRHIPEMEILKTITSRYGSYYIPGNHEYYWQVDQALAAFRGLGFHVLINQAESIQVDGATVQIAGIPDPAARQSGLEMPDFKKLGSVLKPGAFKILLSHQPALADAAVEYDYSLQLSGHTHGGQFFPWNFLIGFFQKYAKGLYRVKNMQLYVNQGTGYWGPSLRLGTYCELTEITLHKQS
jgi:predicted MPP superfamily phosphohydrolase